MKAREALVAYLKETPLELPRVAPRVSDSLPPEHGLVELPLGEGVLILRDARGSAHRLQWDETQREAAARTRTLPAGEFTIVTKRLVRRSDDGTKWHTSSTVHGGRLLRIIAGETTRYEERPAIRLTRRARGERLAMNVQDEDGAGLSIYKQGRRISIDYRLLDSEAEVLQQGPMRYG